MQYMKPSPTVKRLNISVEIIMTRENRKEQKHNREIKGHYD